MASPLRVASLGPAPSSRPTGRLRSNRVLQAVADQQDGVSKRLVSLGVALIVSLSATPALAYENVRVEDVESETLRAGLEAANDRNWVAAERFFQVRVVALFAPVLLPFFSDV